MCTIGQTNRGYSVLIHVHPRRDAAARRKFRAQTDSEYLDWDRYPHSDMKKCVQLAVGCFGKERVMWGTGCMQLLFRLSRLLCLALRHDCVGTYCCADPDTAHRVAAGWPTLEDELKIARVRVQFVAFVHIVRFRSPHCVKPKQ